MNAVFNFIFFGKDIFNLLEKCFAGAEQLSFVFTLHVNSAPPDSALVQDSKSHFLDLRRLTRSFPRPPLAPHWSLASKAIQLKVESFAAGESSLEVFGGSTWADF